MTNKETNITHQPNVLVRRSSRVITHTKSYTPITVGNRYASATAQMADQEVLHPDAHLLFNHGEVQNEPDVTVIIMYQLSLKAVLNKWGERGRGAFHLEMKQIHMGDTFIPLHRK